MVAHGRRRMSVPVARACFNRLLRRRPDRPYSLGQLFNTFLHCKSHARWRPMEPHGPPMSRGPYLGNEYRNEC
jgi:hypothetical protein